jgi:glutathione S-transferase
VIPPGNPERGVITNPATPMPDRVRAAERIAGRSWAASADSYSRAITLSIAPTKRNQYAAARGSRLWALSKIPSPTEPGMSRTMHQLDLVRRPRVAPEHGRGPDARAQATGLPGGLAAASVQRPLLRSLGFPSRTVPALRVGRCKVQGSRAISAALEELKPDPRLFPAEAAVRREVEEAERWGEEVLQDATRRIVVRGLRRDWRSVANQLAGARAIQGARLLVGPTISARTSGLTVAWYARLVGAQDEAVRNDLFALVGMLDRIDAWIAAGVLGGDPPNAADFQIATSLGQLMTIEELRASIGPRTAGRLSLRLVPEYPGHSAGVLPQDGLADAGLRRA